MKLSFCELVLSTGRGFDSWICRPSQLKERLSKFEGMANGRAITVRKYFENANGELVVREKRVM